MAKMQKDSLDTIAYDFRLVAFFRGGGEEYLVIKLGSFAFLPPNEMFRNLQLK